jgi:hydrogenase maturation protease
MAVTCDNSAWQMDSSCTEAMLRLRHRLSMYGTAQTEWREACFDRAARNGEQTVTSGLARERAGQPAGKVLSEVPLTLVLGFGNVLLGDDGAGVQILGQLRSELGPEAAHFIDAGTLSFSLLPYIEAANSMLAIDAADINDRAGTVGLYEGAAMDAFLRSTRRRTVHEVGLIDLLDMARLRDCLPPRRALLCIQPGRIDWSEQLSTPVAAALPEAARQASALLQRWQAS